MLSQSATYALLAMAYLAAHRGGGPVLSQTIAEERKIPKNFLSKILNRLVQEGFVHSIRGTGGGFVLARDPSRIRMREVVSLFMRLDDYKRCFLGLETCDGTCALHDRWKAVAEEIEAILEETTLDQIAG